VRTQQYFKSTAFTTSSIFATYNVSPTSLGTYPVYSDSLAYSFPITGVNQGFIFAVASDSNIRAVSVFLKDFGTLDLYYTGSAPLSYGATSEVVNGYTRYIVVIPSGANNLYFRPNGNTGTTTTVYATAPQIEYGDIATAYISNDTTASAVSVGPVANLPRLDYLGSSCPRLLLEPQRTNLAQYSEQFDNAYWTKLNSTITANAAVSPDGYSNADQITDDVTSGSHLVYRIPSSRSTGTAWSIFMKKGTLDFGFIGNVQSSTAFTTAVIDLTNGTVKELQNGSGNTGSVTVQDYGNGWYRVIMQSSANGGGTSIGCSDGSALSGSTKDAIYSGTGKHIFIFGAALEDASYATSYIPTLGAAVTRDVNITEGRVNGSSEMFLTIRGGAYEGYFQR
jgi:hypothetical protein